MTSCVLDNQRLFQTAERNYRRLVRYCELLDEDGQWEQPAQVLKFPIAEMLDQYVQAVLINLAVFCGRFCDTEKNFIAKLPEHNVLQCPESGEAPDALFETAKKVAAAPPILIQLCGVYDQKDDTELSAQFFDAMLNIMLCMIYLDRSKKKTQKNSPGAHFIQQYYEKVLVFLNLTNQQLITPRYLFRKLAAGRITDEFQTRERVYHTHAGEQAPEGGAAVCAAPEEEPGEAGELRKESRRGKTEQLEEQPTADSGTLLESDRECTEVTEVRKEEKAEKTGTLKTEEKPETEARIRKTETKKTEVPKMEARAEKTAVEEVPHRKGLSAENTDSDQKKPVRKQEEIEEDLKELQLQQIKNEIQAIRERKNKEHLEELLEELNELVGLAKIKEEVNSLINLIKVRKLRKSFNMPEMDMTYHMVFTGNPGTGKTTVARLISKIYKELGILSTGTLVETDRAGLVAGYVGQTALKVTEVVNKAIGGVLFIDEAYALTNYSGQGDFGGEVIDTLVKLMEDHRDNLVVIVAGYKEEMKQFLASNTGLVSRFNKFLDFPDYTISELMDILAEMARKAGVTIEEEAFDYIKEQLRQFTEEQLGQFGNARGIRNLFEKLMVNQANRIVTCEEPSIEMLSTILRVDVENVELQP